MELWIDGWIHYFLGIWDNATFTDYLILIACVAIVGGFFNFRQNSTK